jgi:hypothetical protein
MTILRWCAANAGFGFRIDAAAAELEIIVEEELAGGVTGLDGESGEGVTGVVELEHSREVDRADDVDVVKEEGLVETGGIFEEKPGGFFEAAAGVEKDFFAGNFDAHPKIVV